MSYAMPEGATLATNWWVRGAYEDVKEINLGDAVAASVREGADRTVGGWRFPFGTNEYSSLWAFSWGKLRFVLGDAETEIVAVGAPMSAVPFCSRLWSAETTNGARLVTWENFAQGRMPLSAPRSEGAAGTVNAQIELKRNGDFVTRSNEVETVCRRIDDFDWDGDGIVNWLDGDPYRWDGDYTGQEEWWRAYDDETVSLLPIQMIISGRD